MAAKVVSNNSKMAELSGAWPSARQVRTREDRNASDDEIRRLSAVPAFLVWITISALIWGGIIGAVVLVR
jgi:hypothetical protein